MERDNMIFNFIKNLFLTIEDLFFKLIVVIPILLPLIIYGLLIGFNIIEFSPLSMLIDFLIFVVWTIAFFKTLDGK